MQAIIHIFMYMIIWKGCDAQQRNFTLASTTITAEKLQEKVNDYGQCYVDVVVHNSSSFQFGLLNATVIALTNDSGKVYYADRLTDINGHVCIPVLCHKAIRIFVEKNSVRISALNKTMQQRNIPRGFSVKFETNNEVILFYAYAWGTVAGRSGPVYSTKEKGKCNAALTSDYHFVFSYIAIPDRLLSTLPPPTNPDDPSDPKFENAWRYGMTGNRQSCFFKIKIKTLSTQVKISAYSRLDNANGTVYGLFETGPKYDVNAADYTDKAACVEFRCPAVGILDGVEMSTYIEGNIQVPGHPNGCCISNIQSGNIFKVERTKFNTVLAMTSTDKYGSEKGIYINQDPRVARAKCFTGREFLGSEYAMNVNVGYAFEYDCQQDQQCSFVLGK
ncbi:uncharacterized protein LOC132738825 [Ruditapes philippinarum]|uniref:uncharacterized protein LOC132738825 n=1 Tax=Ruditapes philippinarum TaxID=129788 RepID=UPI00295B2555|nr:uncharacterized protein LOC132738825 [Ruditapes philippinarum]